MAGANEQVAAVVRPAVEAAGYDLEEVVITPAGRRSVVRVIVDRDGGVDLDAVAEVSRAVGAAMDDADALGAQPYVLEVSSPGVDRPLTEPRHWRRSIGRLVTTSYDDSAVTGRIVGVDNTTVTLDVDGEHRVLELPKLSSGRIQIEFSRP
jgi:ribosome maturation factor RimP